MLVNNCLLQSSSDNTSVKMHDLMRDLALKITRKNPRFMVKAGMLLRELPNEDEWGEDLEKVSLMFNHIPQIPSGTSPSCPTLSTLILRGNYVLASVPSSFFENMHTLRVLDLSNTLIENLPNSVSDLENLTALLLGQCHYLIYVPSLAKLRSLQVLDLSHSGISKVPQGMDSLVNLKCLYMDHSNKLEMFPSGMLPRLSHLQHLRLRSGSENVAECGIFSCGSVECIWSSSSTAALVTKEIEEVHCSPLQSLEILRIYSLPNFSALFMCGGIALPHGTLLNLKQLDIYDCPKLKKLFSPRLLQHFHNLKLICIWYCKQMEEVITADDEERTDANASKSNHSSSNINQDKDTADITLPVLTSLTLCDLRELKSIYSGMMVGHDQRDAE
ncbi:hypothetical protein F0562_000393 [Nyssa sinensis]|uniref:Disease resistance protein At4g27190-like leucine-rich repeats domain-containing protein n=1 Tax=Nyssa sinensis TaxID=561372 RepID=A0A5J5C0G8_9ASTE|nr:hypothetical protein F0562_000393 [Nyssa sinensis]